MVLLWLDWLVFCEYGFSVFPLWCPLATPTVLLGFLLPWAWGITSRPLQQNAAIVPYLGWGVSPHCCPSWPSRWDSSSRPSCACTARRSNQSILKISPGISLEGMMLKLKLQYFGHLMRRVDSLEKPLMEGLGAGGEGEDRGWDGWMASLTRWTWVSVNSGSWWWTGRPGVLWFMGSQRIGHDWATDLIWSDMIFVFLFLTYFTLYNRLLLHQPQFPPRILEPDVFLAWNVLPPIIHMTCFLTSPCHC